MAIQSSFIDASVFSQTPVNRLCDQLVRLVLKYIDQGRSSDFSFYGKPALMYIDMIVSREIAPIQFITGYDRIFRAIKAKAPKELALHSSYCINGVLILEKDGIIIEVHKSSRVVKSNVVSGVTVYDYDIGAQKGQPEDPDPKPGTKEYNEPIGINPDFKDI